MIIVYFGADRALQPEDSALNINRRNMALLFELTQNSEVSQVINCIRTTRTNYFKQFRNYNKRSKIINWYYAPILPERGFLKKITLPINRGLLYVFNFNILKRVYSNKAVNWCYWPKGFLEWEYLGSHGEMVFDTDHNIIDDPNLPPKSKVNQEQLLIRAGHKATLVLSSARSMLAWYHDKGFTNTLLVFNGVFKERIQLQLEELPQDKLHVVYSGTLSKWINTEWLIDLIAEHPNWQFHIIGKDYKMNLAATLKAFKNVIVYGFLKPQELDKIIKKCHVALGLYRPHPALDVNSMKLYDYLAQGKYVVLNDYHNDLESDFDRLVHVASNYESFKFKIENVRDIEPYKFETFLEKALWTTRVKRIILILKETV